MQKETQSKPYLKTKSAVIVIFGFTIFTVFLSLFIYKSGNFIIKNYWYSHHVEENISFSSEADSVSGGDAAVGEIVSDIGKHGLTGQSTSSTSSSTNPTGLPRPDIQYVIISFDGSRSLSMWNETRQFAKDMAAKGKSIHFTYFINPIYLITKSTAKKIYQPPRAKMGDSLIGYANSEQDVKDRVEQINFAFLEGHEIGSHNVGHFSGSKWSRAEWLQEFNSFDSIVSNVQKNNPGVLIQPWAFDMSKIIGFRAPELGVNSDLYKVLSEKKYLYDTSGMRMPSKYPVKDKDGIWHIGLGIIKMKNSRLGLSGDITNTKPQYVLSMDYNFWMTQSRVKNIAKKGTPLWNSFYSEVKNSYSDYFNKNYEGNHAPVVIGHHFSLWNDGVYWEALKSFADDVCGKPNVKCVTFKEYVDYLNSVAK